MRFLVLRMKHLIQLFFTLEILVPFIGGKSTPVFQDASFTTSTVNPTIQSRQTKIIHHCYDEVVFVDQTDITSKAKMTSLINSKILSTIAIQIKNIIQKEKQTTAEQPNAANLLDDRDIHTSTKGVVNDTDENINSINPLVTSYNSDLLINNLTNKNDNSFATSITVSQLVTANFNNKNNMYTESEAVVGFSEDNNKKISTDDRNIYTSTNDVENYTNENINSIIRSMTSHDSDVVTNIQTNKNEIITAAYISNTQPVTANFSDKNDMYKQSEATAVITEVNSKENTIIATLTDFYTVGPNQEINSGTRNNNSTIVDQITTVDAANINTDSDTITRYTKENRDNGELITSFNDINTDLSTLTSSVNLNEGNKELSVSNQQVNQSKFFHSTTESLSSASQPNSTDFTNSDSILTDFRIVTSSTNEDDEVINILTSSESDSSPLTTNINTDVSTQTEFPITDTDVLATSLPVISSSISLVSLFTKAAKSSKKKKSYNYSSKYFISSTFSTFKTRTKSLKSTKTHTKPNMSSTFSTFKTRTKSLKSNKTHTKPRHTTLAQEDTDSTILENTLIPEACSSEVKEDLPINNNKDYNNLKESTFSESFVEVKNNLPLKRGRAPVLKYLTTTATHKFDMQRTFRRIKMIPKNNVNQSEIDSNNDENTNRSVRNNSSTANDIVITTLISYLETDSNISSLIKNISHNAIQPKNMIPITKLQEKVYTNTMQPLTEVKYNVETVHNSLKENTSNSTIETSINNIQSTVTLETDKYKDQDQNKKTHPIKTEIDNSDNHIYSSEYDYYDNDFNFMTNNTKNIFKYNETKGYKHIEDNSNSTIITYGPKNYITQSSINSTEIPSISILSYLTKTNELHPKYDGIRPSETPRINKASVESVLGVYTATFNYTDNTTDQTNAKTKTIPSNTKENTIVLTNSTDEITKTDENMYDHTITLTYYNLASTNANNKLQPNKSYVKNYTEPNEIVATTEILNVLKPKNINKKTTSFTTVFNTKPTNNAPLKGSINPASSGVSVQSFCSRGGSPIILDKRNSAVLTLSDYKGKKTYDRFISMIFREDVRWTPPAWLGSLFSIKVELNDSNCSGEIHVVRISFSAKNVKKFQINVGDINIMDVNKWSRGEQTVEKRGNYVGSTVLLNFERIPDDLSINQLKIDACCYK